VNLEIAIYVNIEDLDEEKAGKLTDELGDVLIRAELGNTLGSGGEESIRSIIVTRPIEVEEGMTPSAWMQSLFQGAFQAVFPTDNDEFAEQLIGSVPKAKKDRVRKKSAGRAKK
jgi:hypothetical protein